MKAIPILVAGVIGAVIGASAILMMKGQGDVRVPLHATPGTAASSAQPISEAVPVPPSPPASKRLPARPSAPERRVVVNGQRIEPGDLAVLERNYRVRAVDGDYWYDAMTGAWGPIGGPTAGIIVAGLDFGAPMPADASHGDTGVFINGRELHRTDVARLMQLGPVYRGRFWMDAQGNYGIEGGPALGNLWAAANQNGAKKEGILSTWDKTGVAVFGY